MSDIFTDPTAIITSLASLQEQAITFFSLLIGQHDFTVRVILLCVDLRCFENCFNVYMCTRPQPQLIRNITNWYTDKHLDRLVVHPSLTVQEWANIVGLK